MAERMISAAKLVIVLAKKFRNKGMIHYDDLMAVIADVPTASVIPVETVSAYLQQKLDEWEALGERKWDPMNAWGYNFIRACQDDLDKYTEGGNET